MAPVDEETESTDTQWIRIFHEETGNYATVSRAALSHYEERRWVEAQGAVVDDEGEAVNLNAQTKAQLVALGAAQFSLQLDESDTKANLIAAIEAAANAAQT